MNTREIIINNLHALQMSDASIEKILTAVDKMPGKDHLSGALLFLTQLADKSSQREAYYQHSQFLAEYFCTISNLGLFAVGIYYEDFATILAATFSAISHAIPLKRLNELDKIGVLGIFVNALAYYKVAMARPEVLAWGAGAMTVNVLDTVISRRHLETIGPSLHVVWHFAAALALWKFNQAKVEVYGIDHNEIKTLVLAAVANKMPDFLTDTYKLIDDQIRYLASNSTCVVL